jgi:hypothetical protein
MKLKSGRLDDVISMRERAERAIGKSGLKRLEQVGLTVVTSQRGSELNHVSRYEVGTKKVIGHVEVIDEGTARPVTDLDENGYEVVYDSQKGYIFTYWIGKQSCGEFEVIG